MSAPDFRASLTSINKASSIPSSACSIDISSTENGLPLRYQVNRMMAKISGESVALTQVSSCFLGLDAPIVINAAIQFIMPGSLMCPPVLRNILGSPLSLAAQAVPSRLARRFA